MRRTSLRAQPISLFAGFSPTSRIWPFEFEPPASDAPPSTVWRNGARLARQHILQAPPGTRGRRLRGKARTKGKRRLPILARQQGDAPRPSRVPPLLPLTIDHLDRLVERLQGDAA